MSIKVPLDDLPEAMTERGAGYLLTTPSDGDGGRPHVMHVRFEQIDSAESTGPSFRAPIGRSATRNIEARPGVTLLFPPDDGGYSLIVDATAVVRADDSADGEGAGPAMAVVTAVDAVLHRPA